MSLVKNKIIDLGGYKPARWFVDHIVDRNRLRAHKARLALLRSLVSPGQLCFDVGANIGDYTAALLATGARVVAVDPQPSAVKELRARFLGEKRLVVEPVGLGCRAETAEFFIRDHHGASSFLENWEGGGYKERLDVQVVTIQDLITAYGVPNYVKLDVEGYELQVVRGLISKIDLISFEYHLNDGDCALKLEIIEFLRRLGSLTFNIVPEGGQAFIWPKFVSFEEFHTIFPMQMSVTNSTYGDIFVMIS